MGSMGQLSYIKDSKTLVVSVGGATQHRPSLYKISIHDSRECSLDFYAALLQMVFHYENDASFSSAMKIKLSGMLEIGNFTKDVAETKISIAKNYAAKLHLKFEYDLVRMGDYVIKKS